jgi:hypothetical protein
VIAVVGPPMIDTETCEAFTPNGWWRSSMMTTTRCPDSIFVHASHGMAHCTDADSCEACPDKPPQRWGRQGAYRTSALAKLPGAAGSSSPPPKSVGL